MGHYSRSHYLQQKNWFKYSKNVISSFQLVSLIPSSISTSIVTCIPLAARPLVHIFN